MCEKIKIYRLKKGITQKKLSSSIGVSQNFLSNLEKSKCDIKGSTLIKLSDKLDVCVADLLDCKCSKCKNKENQ